MRYKFNIMMKKKKKKKIKIIFICRFNKNVRLFLKLIHTKIHIFKLYYYSENRIRKVLKKE